MGVLVISAVVLATVVGISIAWIATRSKLSGKAALILALASVIVVVSAGVLAMRRSAAITIELPKDGDRVAMAEQVTGEARDLNQTDEVWLVLRAQGSTRYYPQIGPLIVGVDGSWGTSVTIGQRGERDKRFEVIALLATREAGGEFSAYLRDAEQRGEFPGIERLPRGVLESDHVAVIRR